MYMQCCEYHLRQLAVPWNIWLGPRCFAFIKSDYSPSAFHKNQHWSLTHRLKTACARYRDQEFSGGTGWNCSQIGNRRQGDKGGEREGEGKAGQEIDAEFMFSQGSEAGSWVPRKASQTQKRGGQGLGSPQAARQSPASTTRLLIPAPEF